MSAWMQALFEAHRGADGVCRPFVFKDKQPKKVEVTVQNTINSDLMQEHMKLFSMVTELSRENKEMVLANAKLQREIDSLKSRVIHQEGSLKAIETMVCNAGDDINEEFKRNILLLIGTSKS